MNDSAACRDTFDAGYSAVHQATRSKLHPRPDGSFKQWQTRGSRCQAIGRICTFGLKHAVSIETQDRWAKPTGQLVGSRRSKNLVVDRPLRPDTNCSVS